MVCFKQLQGLLCGGPPQQSQLQGLALGGQGGGDLPRSQGGGRDGVACQVVSVLLKIGGFECFFCVSVVECLVCSVFCF